MKQMMAALMLGAMLQVVPAAHAATSIDTAGFSLRDTGGLDAIDMSVLSDQGGTVRIAMPSLAPSPVDPGYDFRWSQLVGSVHDGYRITSLTLSAKLSGSLFVTPVEDCWGCSIDIMGSAVNYGRLHLSVGTGGDWTNLPVAAVDNVNGSQAFGTTAAQAIDGDFALDIQSHLGAEAVDTVQLVQGTDWWSYRTYPSFASAQLSDFVLTVQVAAVPEPGIYAMLLAGLGLLGVAARRRAR